MRIYILDVDRRVQPRKQGFVYPRHNKDFGVEQDFLEFLYKSKSLLAKSPREADWHYLPVFWTRWHLNHDYGKVGIEDLQQIIDSSIIDDRRTFTVCQYDDGPLVNLGGAIQFLASRKTVCGKDIPLLCKRHRKPWLAPRKQYIASFVGRLNTHPIRSAMAAVLQGKTDVSILDGDLGARAFIKMVLQSHLVLSPRGYGGSSFRFFEAMQLGVVPVLIGDIDTRPFKRFLPWRDVSFYVRDESNLIDLLNTLSRRELLAMGERAANFYSNYLVYQKWCSFVIKELKDC